MVLMNVSLLYTLIQKANQVSACISTASWLNSSLLWMMLWIMKLSKMYTSFWITHSALTFTLTHTHTHTHTHTSSHTHTQVILLTCPLMEFSHTHIHTHSFLITPRISYGHLWTNSSFVRLPLVLWVWALITSPRLLETLALSFMSLSRYPLSSLTYDSSRINVTNHYCKILVHEHSNEASAPLVLSFTSVVYY